MNPIEIGFDFTGKESAKDLAQALIPLISSVQATGEAMHNLASEDITSRLNSYQKAIEAIYTATTKANQSTEEGVAVLLSMKPVMEKNIEGMQNLLLVREKIASSSDSFAKKIISAEKEIEKNTKGLIDTQNKLRDGFAITPGEISKLKDKIIAHTNALNRLKVEITELNTQMKNNVAIVEAEASAISAMRELAKELNADLESMSDKERENSSRGKELTSTIQGLNVIINAYDRNISGVDTKLGIMAANTAKLESVTNKLKIANEGNTLSLEDYKVKLKNVETEINTITKLENENLAAIIANEAEKKKLRERIALGVDVLTGKFQAALKKQEDAEIKLHQKQEEIQRKKEAAIERMENIKRQRDARRAEVEARRDAARKERENKQLNTIEKNRMEADSISSLIEEIRSLTISYNNLSKEVQESGEGEAKRISERVILLKQELAEREAIRDAALNVPKSAVVSSSTASDDQNAKQEFDLQSLIDLENTLAAAKENLAKVTEESNEILLEEAVLLDKIDRGYATESSTILELEDAINMIEESMLRYKDSLDLLQKSESELNAQEKYDIGFYERMIKLIPKEIALLKELIDVKTQIANQDEKILAATEREKNATDNLNRALEEEANSYDGLSKKIALYRAEQGKASNPEQYKKIADEIKKIEAQQNMLTGAVDTTTIAYKLQTFVVRDLFRMAAGMITIIPIMALFAGVQSLWEEWTKVGDEEQRAIDKMKEYADGIKDLDKKLSDIPDKLSSKKEFNKAELDNQKNIMLGNPNGDINPETKKPFDFTDAQRFRAFNQLKGMANGIFDDNVKKEGLGAYLKSDAGLKALNNLQKYINLKTELEETLPAQQDILKQERDAQTQKQAIINKVAKKFASGSTVSAQFKQKVESGVDISRAELDSEYRRQANMQGDEEYLTDPRVAYYQKLVSETSYKKNWKGEIVKGDELSVFDIENEEKKIAARKSAITQENKIREDKIAALQGDTKNPKGRSLKPKSKEWEIENDIHKEMMEQNQAVYDSTEKSTNDIMGLYDINDDEAKLHFNRQMDIIKDYRNRKIKTNEELANLEMQANLEQQKINNDSINGRKAALDDLEKYNLKLFTEIDNANKKIAETNKKAQDKLDEYNKQGLKNKLAEDKAGRWNPFSAFFGAGGGTPVKDWKGS